MKRIFLFIVTNLAVLALLSLVLFVIEQVFGVRLGQDGLGGLLAFAAVFGFGGALISLALSKWTAKRIMGVRVIGQPQSDLEAWLLGTVARLAEQARIGMPEVGIFDAEEMNAFATGARRTAALVAVSSGLLRGMTRPQAEAVLGHEMSHVANGDMVTLTLLQGVLNTFVIFLASMIVCWFSRYREFRADRGGANLAGTANMIGALESLKRSSHGEPMPAQMQAFGINGEPGGMMRLFMSHPPLDERIAALRGAGGLTT